MSKLLAAELGNVPEIDLHGMTVDEALRNVENFIYSEQHNNTEAVRLICGRGTGELYIQLTAWLNKVKQLGKLVEDYTSSNVPHQQGGVILVSLVSLR
jgi:DNA-nicking Smr family endonuclease